MERTRTRLWLAVAVLLYVAFLLLDLTHAADSTGVKYLGVLCCLAAALPHSGTTDGRLVTAALALTAAADWFLLVLDRHYPVGIALFCVVQGLYAVRLHRLRTAAPILLLCRALPLALFPLGAPPLTALALFYFANLALNAAQSIVRRNVSRTAAWFCAGLVLLTCCDFCIGLHRLAVCPAAYNAVWLFYLPSQLCIAVSSMSHTRSSPI